MKRLLLITVLSATVTAPSLASAQTRPAERVGNHAEKHADHRQSADDALDHARLTRLLADFDRARAARDLVALRNIDVRLRKMLHEEARETERELAGDRRELRRSRREKAQQPRGTRARRDDRRDARDDRRDLRQEQRMAAERLAIARSLRPLYLRYDPPALTRKRQGIVQLIALARQERRHDRQERREDRRERREDRR